MTRTDANADALRLRLMGDGVQSAQNLAVRLGVSQPTISRQLAALGSRIERIGRGPATRYALRRPVRASGSEWPLYRIEPSGRIASFGLLRSLHGGFRVNFTSGRAPAWVPRDFGRLGVFPGLPFFLQDIRPQGFLGRAVAHSCADSLMVPADVQNWSDDDALVYFLSRGADLPGDFVVGDAAAQGLAAGATANSVIAVGDRASAYPQLAAQAERGEVVGSSAGGEQPKFAAVVREASGITRQVLVKFTTAQPSAVRDRWSDLLVCEHLALQSLGAELGVEVSQSNLFEFEGRRFLEVTRFDRIGATGRRGVLSLGAIVDANSFELSGEAWGDVAVEMSRAGLLSEVDARALRRIWCFGQCIANNDMHRGNCSFLPNDEGPFGLAPVYDMLPMAYAPTRQGTIPAEVARPPAAVPRHQEDWDRAGAAARVFWGVVKEDPVISENFRRMAAAVFSTLESRF